MELSHVIDANEALETDIINRINTLTSQIEYLQNNYNFYMNILVKNQRKILKLD
jgi:hypothetical protein